MPYDVVHLNREQINQIKNRIMQEGVVTDELVEELLDHFCVAVEEAMKEGKSFPSAFDHVFDTLQEDELKTTEMKTKELLDGKRIFYPDLEQSFILVVAAFLIDWIKNLTVRDILFREENLEMQTQWLDQHYLWILLLSSLLTLGGPIVYAIWEIKRTRVNAAVFSFRSVPAYVYGVILLIVVFSWIWLEPLTFLFPFLHKLRITYTSQLQIENFSPLNLTLISIFTGALGELLFRGIILKGLLMTTTPLRAILWSSLFCALFSFPYFIAVFIISLMLGWLYWKTRSLYPAIFLMVMGSVIRYIVMLFMDHPKDFFFHFNWWGYVEHNLMIYIPLVIVALLLTAGLFYYLHRRLSAASSV